jgi:hypothetical protein
MPDPTMTSAASASAMRTVRYTKVVTRLDAERQIIPI